MTNTWKFRYGKTDEATPIATMSFDICDNKPQIKMQWHENGEKRAKTYATLHDALKEWRFLLVCPYDTVDAKFCCSFPAVNNVMIGNSSLYFKLGDNNFIACSSDPNFTEQQIERLDELLGIKIVTRDEALMMQTERNDFYASLEKSFVEELETYLQYYGDGAKNALDYCQTNEESEEKR